MAAAAEPPRGMTPPVFLAYSTERTYGIDGEGACFILTSVVAGEVSVPEAGPSSAQAVKGGRSRSASESPRKSGSRAAGARDGPPHASRLMSN
jgi:hypothetical protein